MTEKKMIRRYLRRSFRPLGWGLVGYYLLMNVLVIAAMAADAAVLALEAVRYGHPILPQEKLMEAVSANAWGYLITLCVGVVVMLAWKGWDFFRDEIFHRNRRMRIPTFLGITCIFLGCQVSVSLYATLLEALLNSMGVSAMAALEAATVQSETVSMFLYAAIGAPVVEELIFRGFVQRSLMPFGKKFAIFGSALLFGMFHGNLIQTPYAFLVGLVLGYVAAEYSIWWAIVLHMINNMVLADLLPRMLSGLPQMAQDIILTSIIWVFAIAGLVILIVKRRSVKAYLTGECMDRRCLRGFFLNSGFLVLATLMVINMLMMVMPI